MRSLVQLFDTCLNIDYITNEFDASYTFSAEGRTFYIYFQCSRSKVDWLHNFMFAKKPYKGMDIPYRVHRGFLKCWKSIEDIIINKITEKASNGTFKWTKIITIGYSHGAALAMLSHECCWFHRPDIEHNIKTIAFDGPRVYASFKVKEALKPRWKNFILIRNHNDLVTHVPPFIFGYSHVGSIIKVGDSAKYGCIKSHYPANIRESLVNCELNETWEKQLFS